jgi:hypothetical protein
LTEDSQFVLLPSSSTSGEGALIVGATSTGTRLLGTQVYENNFSLPHSLFSCCSDALLTTRRTQM